MSQLKNFPLPDVGEGLTEAEILNWRVGPGDQVELNQTIVEIETAKASVELPSPYAGRVGELLAQPGQTVEVGTPILAFELDDQQAESEEAQQAAGGSGEQGGEEQVANLVGYGPRSSSAKRRPRKRAPPPRPRHNRPPTPHLAGAR